MAIQPRSLYERDVLDESRCRDRLRDVGVARVLISVRCLPAAMPVLIEMRPHHLIFASVEDAVVEAARRGDVLAVQVDGIDPDGATWSVHVTGVAHLPEHNDSLAKFDELTELSSALEHGATLVAIPLTVISGERIRWTFPRISG
jgi:hypothetical protein